MVLAYDILHKRGVVSLTFCRPVSVVCWRASFQGENQLRQQRTYLQPSIYYVINIISELIGHHMAHLRRCLAQIMSQSSSVTSHRRDRPSHIVVVDRVRQSIPIWNNCTTVSLAQTPSRIRTFPVSPPVEKLGRQLRRRQLPMTAS